jgi:hypothetical protein
MLRADVHTSCNAPIFIDLKTDVYTLETKSGSCSACHNCLIFYLKLWDVLDSNQ